MEKGLDRWKVLMREGASLLRQGKVNEALTKFETVFTARQEYDSDEITAGAGRGVMACCGELQQVSE